MRRIVPALAVLAGAALPADGARAQMTIAPVACPFETPPPDHHATCLRATRDDGGARISFDVATLSPHDGSGADPVLYIPGGPGEAPVAADGYHADLLSFLFDRPVILFNPRGTAGTDPRPVCDFGDTLFDEDFGNDASREILAGCIARMEGEGVDPEWFTSRRIADDIDALVRALGIGRAGVYGISYGTEAGLHLIADRPGWLGFAILDSVSVPGLSGTRDEIEGRDRFLAALDDSCFARARCIPIARHGAADLADWAARFDEAPLTLHLTDDIAWSFDGSDVLDYLAGLAVYPDGLGLAQGTIDAFATARLRAMGWMLTDTLYDLDFVRESLPLMLQAYADTFEPADFETVRAPSRYDRDLDDAANLLAFYRLWRGARPREAAFLDAPAREAGVPVLVLSGGLDPLTPPEWAAALHARLTGLEHYVYPLLGHAVSLSRTGDAVSEEMDRQIACAGRAVPAFLDPAIPADPDCDAYRAKGTQ